jgi:hypothetical protein
MKNEFKLKRDGFRATSYYRRYSTSEGNLLGVLATARKDGDGPPFVELRGRGSTGFGYYYKDEDVFGWLASKDIEWEEAQPKESSNGCNSCNLLTKYPKEIIEENTKLRIKTRELELRLSELLEDIDEMGLLSLGQILSAKQPLKSFCGVYFLIHKRKIVYVGQSVNVYARVATHANTLKEFDSWSFIESEPDQLNDLESLYIRKFNPPLNLTKPVTIAVLGEIRSRVMGDA